jgi:hypothetical protein
VNEAIDLALADWERAYVVPTRWWTALADGRARCDVHPRECTLRPGQRGMCFVRARDVQHEGVVITTYGRSNRFCVDPIEEKPLNHCGTALPGVLEPRPGSWGRRRLPLAM